MYLRPSSRYQLVDPVDSLPAERPNRRALGIEIVVILGALWLPYAYIGVADFLRGGLSSTSSTYTGQIYRPIHALFLAAIPILLFWRMGEPLSKLGFTKFTLSDAAMAAVLFFVMEGTYYALRPLVYSLRDMNMAVIYVHRVRLLPWWATAVITCFYPFMEEVVQRGYVCARILGLGWGKAAAIGISAVVFAIPHLYYGWAPVIPIFLHGVIFALVFCSTKRIWPLVIAHSAYDFSFVVLSHVR